MTMDAEKVSGTSLAQRLISSLTLPHFLKTALAEKQYRTVDDLNQVTAEDLVIELSISRNVAEDILRAVHAPPQPTAFTSHALDIQTSTATALLSQSPTRFSTLSTSIDRLISHFSPSHAASAGAGPSRMLRLKGKGKEKEEEAGKWTWAANASEGPVSAGMVLELAGPPGAGKTAVVVGLALSARIRPEERQEEGEAGKGGEPVEVLVVDTEGAITPLRLKRAAKALDPDSSPESISAVLEGIHIARVATQVQMVAFLHTLEDWLDSHPKVGLVIIDTLSYHFRQPTLDMNTRKRIMDLVKQQIAKAATVHRCAVVITNQLATKLLTAENKPATFETGDRAVLMPQLGDTWTTEKTIRVLLFRGGSGDDLRYAHGHVASASGGDDVPWASFDIDSDGLACDVPPIPQQI